MKALLARFKGREPSAATKAVSVFEGAPLFLMLGSIRDCSAKDAHAYARGLAERYITAPDIAWIRVHEEKANGRFVYEIHEGGPGLSVLAAVQAELVEGQTVRIALANGRSATVEDLHGEMYTLVSPDQNAVEVLAPVEGAIPAQQDARSVAELVGKVKLNKMHKEGENLPRISAVIMILASFAFILTGAAYTLVQAGALETDSMLAPIKAGHRSDDKDNPALKLEEARQEAEKSGASLSYLRKDAKGWSWGLAQ